MFFITKAQACFHEDRVILPFGLSLLFLVHLGTRKHLIVISLAMHAC